jgi:hypothetical protein
MILKKKILQWCEIRLQKPINTAEMKDISEIYDNLAKQETMVKMTESLNANNSCLPLTSGDGLNER